MSFFQSDVVRAEMAEISELQEEVYNNVFKFPQLCLKKINSIILRFLKDFWKNKGFFILV